MKHKLKLKRGDVAVIELPTGEKIVIDSTKRVDQIGTECSVIFERQPKAWKIHSIFDLPDQKVDCAR